KKPVSSVTNSTATPERVKTSHKAACIICRALTTITAEISVAAAAIKKKICIGVMLPLPLCLQAVLACLRLVWVNRSFERRQRPGTADRHTFDARAALEQI